ncbi:MAG: DNA-binding response regulator [Dyadobacter sp. 50-39]|uniref:LytR/AlgR family response regulator transcription factor n=1 Tax=Dyadobacter sp. 50-39 TaxID=1895756 RepID=UPI0009687D79|nr:LytTR family DNA-binding domain-containing protein [Dyadobacter sp. 50-39]OJV15240.1 MAG: DNA-binding response regulator [Dyadobacter sp. 50-39]
MIYSAVLIDDETHCTESLDLLLRKADLGIEVIAKFNEPAAAVTFLNANPVDLIFLDIEMPEMNGFQLLESVHNPEFDLVFTTAYDQYAIKAFGYSAMNYLLKPIDPEELSQTVTKWIAKKNKALEPAQIRLLHHFFQNPSTPKKRVAVPTSDGLEFLEIDRIIRCESESNYTWLHSVDNQKLLVCRTLKEVESILSESGFLRIHHSHLINPSFVRKFIRHDGGSIIMDDGMQLSVSRTRKERLFELFDNVKRL